MNQAHTHAMSPSRALDRGKVVGLTEKQLQVLQIVTDKPGVSIRAVAKQLDCSHTTASHHLAVLVKKGAIVREKQGRHIRHFLRQQNTAKNVIQPLVRDERKRRIMQYLVDHPRKQWTANELATQVGVSHGLLLRTLHALSDQDCVELLRPRSRYYVRTASKLCRLAEDLGLDAPEQMPTEEPVATPYDFAARLITR